MNVCHRLGNGTISQRQGCPRQLGKAPWGVAADRGFGTKTNEELCAQKGVKRICLPRKGRLSQKQKQKQSWFKRLQCWRAGVEAAISVLKRKYCLRRSLSRGYEGTKTWVANGIFAYTENSQPDIGSSEGVLR